MQGVLQREGNEIAQLKGYAESSAVIVTLGRQEKCRSVGRQPLIWGMCMKSCELQLTQCCYCAMNCLVFLHCHFLKKTLKEKVCKADSQCSWPLAVPEVEFAGTGKTELQGLQLNHTISNMFTAVFRDQRSLSTKPKPLICY